MLGENGSKDSFALVSRFLHSDYLTALAVFLNRSRPMLK
jgi:hypothetical protein